MKQGRRPADGDTWCCKPKVRRGRRQKVTGDRKLGRRPLRVGVYCDGRGAQRSQEKQQNCFKNALLGSMQVVTSVMFMISVTMS